MDKSIWYAVMRDGDDDDWSTGSYDLDEARNMVQRNRDIYPDGYIAVIDAHTDNPVCIEEIHDI